MAADESLAAAMTAEYDDMIPPESEFKVKYSDSAGRYMVSTVALKSGSEFLIETPLVAWPLVPQLLEPYNCQANTVSSAPWCERCLCCLSQRCATVETDDDANEENPPERRVRRRLAENENVEGETVARSFFEVLELSGDSKSSSYCSECESHAETHTTLLPPTELWKWRRWQATKSPESCVGLEAFGRCFAQVALTARRVREGLGVSPSEAVRIALRPFDRLAAPAEDGLVSLHGTSAEEVAAELANSEFYRRAVEDAVGCPKAAMELLSASSVAWLAGRLVLNAAGALVPNSSPSGEPLRAACIFVLLSTMNHSCDPSAEAVFSSSSTVSLRTKRDVEVGEPLTLAYVSGDDPVEARRERLRHWFFECDCLRCETESKIEAALGSLASTQE